MFSDSHSHLSMPDFENDVAQVLVRARRAGVSRVMTCATSLRDAQRNLSLAREHGLKASVGLHPHQAKEWDESSETALRALVASSADVAAIGEVGLDFHYNYSDPVVQQEVLRRQVRLARAVGLPLVIHCRAAREAMKGILTEENARDAGGVLHCFSEDATFARFCLDQGFFISFSGIVTFKKAESIREAAMLVPSDRLLVETDAPYLAPAPHRGERNEPALVVEVARFVASLKGMTEEAIARATTENFDRLFGRRGDPK